MALPPKRQPEALGEILARLLTQRGYARTVTTGQLETAWKAAVGEALAPHTRVGSVKRGNLEVLVANSILAQELGFQKDALLTKLRQLAPDENIQGLKFRVGKVH